MSVTANNYLVLGDDMTDPWNHYEKMVLNELQRLNDQIDKLGVEVSHVHRDLHLLKYKSTLFASVFGSVGGFLIYLATHWIDKIGIGK